MQIHNQNNPLSKWHEVVKTNNSQLLDEILAEEVVFHSPVLWTPQKGKFITKMYLAAAAQVLGNQFTYLREVISENEACLEFNAKIGEVTVNGVDLIKWNDEGKIIDFKVMVRPLKGMQAIHQKMAEMLQKLQS